MGLEFLKSINSVTSSQAADKMEEKATLIFGEQTIKSLKELREHFDKEACLAALKDGTLYRWLVQHYYEKEAQGIKRLRIEDKDCLRTLCKILSVDYAANQELSEEEKNALEAKRAEVSKFTSDEKILNALYLVAMNQEELAQLIDAGETTIYLCNDAFTIPLRKSGITYIGIGTVELENPFTKEQYQKAGITVENITLPEKADPETEAFAKAAAKENGYDDFAENHTELATAFHKALKIRRMIPRYSLPLNSSIASKFFTSKSECENAKKDALSKAYHKASDYVTPGNSKCFAKDATTYYCEILMDIFQPLMDDLQRLCSLTKNESLFKQIEDKVKNCKTNLNAAFEEELTDSADYYAMYNFDYFMDQVDVEEHDFCVSDDNTITKFFEALLTDNIQYTIPDILSTVREMEDDLNEHADTFFKAAHTEYENYVKKIEELIDMLGKNNMPAMNENESLKEYLSRLCVKQAV